MTHSVGTIRPDLAYGNKRGYGCLKMETVKDRPNGAIGILPFHYKIYQSNCSD